MDTAGRSTNRASITGSLSAPTRSTRLQLLSAQGTLMEGKNAQNNPGHGVCICVCGVCEELHLHPLLNPAVCHCWSTSQPTMQQEEGGGRRGGDRVGKEEVKAEEREDSKNRKGK